MWSSRIVFLFILSSGLGQVISLCVIKSSGKSKHSTIHPEQADFMKIAEAGGGSIERSISRGIHLQNATTSFTMTSLKTSTLHPSLHFSQSLWYAKVIKNTFETNGTFPEEISRAREMLAEMDSLLNPDGHRSMMSRASVIQVANRVYRAIVKNKFKTLMSDHDLCSTEHVLRHISCRDRCGQAPNTRILPGQCGCDSDCFVLGDCCEDIHSSCPINFVQSVTRLYGQRQNYTLPHCYQHSEKILNNAGQLKPLREPLSFDIVCLSEVSKDDVVRSAQSALFKSFCQSRKLWDSHETGSRVCGRPDVLVCASPNSVIDHDFYPVHLLCLSNTLSHRLKIRYRAGLNDMEIIGQYGSCSYLRESSNSSLPFSDQALKNPWSGIPLWKLKVTGLSRSGVNYFYLETSKWGCVRCSGGSEPVSWTCETYGCLKLQLLDNISMKRFWPDSIYLKLMSSTPETVLKRDSKIPKRNYRDRSTLNSKGCRDTLDSNVPICSCFKAQAVFNSLGWGTVLVKTEELLVGRCNFRFDSSSSRDQNIKSSQENETSFKTNIVTDTPVHSQQSDNFVGNQLLEEYLPLLWAKRSNECITEKDALLEACFASTILPGLEAVCVLLQEVYPFSSTDNGAEKTSGGVSIIGMFGFRSDQNWFTVVLHWTIIILLMEIWNITKAIQMVV